jgi:hypothetical protein
MSEQEQTLQEPIEEAVETPASEAPADPQPPTEDAEPTTPE